MLDPTIQLFQHRASLLDVQGSLEGVDDAIVDLAAWMNPASDRLTENDWTVLGGIRAALYRKGLRQRARS